MDRRLLWGIVAIIVLVAIGFYFQANKVSFSSGIGLESSETCLGENCDEGDCYVKVADAENNVL